MSTYNQLDLQFLGSQPVMPKNLPDHCSLSPPAAKKIQTDNKLHLVDKSLEC